MKNTEKIKEEVEQKKIIAIDLFISFFPLIFLFFIKILTGTLENIFKRSDLSFLAIILFGQSLLKVVLIHIKNKNKKKTANNLLLICAIFFLGALPACAFYMLIEVNKGNFAIYMCQTIWVIIAGVAYFLIGTVSNILQEKKISKNDFYYEC